MWSGGFSALERQQDGGWEEVVHDPGFGQGTSDNAMYDGVLPVEGGEKYRFEYLAGLSTSVVRSAPPGSSTIDAHLNSTVTLSLQPF